MTDTARNIRNELVACAMAARADGHGRWAKVMLEAHNKLVELENDLENNRKINEMMNSK